jgi:hypothetical protein
MVMPLPEDTDWEADPSHDPAYVARRAAILDAVDHHQRALELDAETGEPGLYVTKSHTLPILDVDAILLTADGLPIQHGETKELLYVLFPEIGGIYNPNIPPESRWLWLEHHHGGRVERFSLTVDGISELQLDESVLERHPSRPQLVRRAERRQLARAKTYQSLIKDLFLTPQRHDPRHM